MRGSFLHNEVLLKPIARHFEALEAQLQFEHFVRRGHLHGFIDLFVLHEDLRICVEAECSTERIRRDRWKARIADADLLLVVTPTTRLASRARRMLQDSGQQLELPGPEQWILSLGPALKRLRTRFPLIPNLNDPRKEEGKQSW